MSNFKEQRAELVQKAAELRRASSERAHPARRRSGSFVALDVNKIETLSKEEEKVRDQYEKEVAEALAKNTTPEPVPEETEDEDDK